MKNEDFVLIYLKYMETCTNKHKIDIWFMTEFSKDIFENLNHIIFFLWIFEKYMIRPYTNTCFSMFGKFWVYILHVVTYDILIHAIILLSNNNFKITLG